MPSTARSTVLTLLATAAMAAASVAAPVCAVAQRGPGVQARTSTVRAVCSGGGEIAVTVQQPGDGSVSAFAVASDLPVGSLWDGGIGVFSTSGGGGGGSSIFTGSSPDSDGTLAFDISVSPTPDPVVRAKIHSQDDSMTCLVRTKPAQQWARASCSKAERLITITAKQVGDELQLSGALGPVVPGSSWGTHEIIHSRHVNRDNFTARGASDDGFVRVGIRYPYAANRIVSVSFRSQRSGHGCSVSMGTHRLQPT